MEARAPIGHRYRPLLRALLGVFGVCLAASGAQARMTPPDDAAAARPDATASATDARHGALPAWWTGFGEPALVAMQQAVAARSASAIGLIVPAGFRAPAASAPLDLQVASVFVSVRVLKVRLLLAEELSRDLATLRALLAAGAPTPQRGQLLADVDLRIAAGERHTWALQARRDELIATLAAWCGVAPAALPEDFRYALDAPRLPAFEAAVPTRVSRAVLAKRADVGRALAQLGAERQRAPLDGPSLAAALHRLTGWIELPAVDAAVPDTIVSADADDKLARIVDRAERDVRESLEQLALHSRQTSAQAKLLRTRQIDLAATESRLEIGSGSQVDVLLARQQLLFEGDRLALESGNLALAWMQLEAATGGQALAAEAP